MNKKMQDRAAKAQQQYEIALAQAQAVPSGYTKRELKKADRARKLAATPVWRRVVGGVIGIGLVLTIVIACGASAAARSAEVRQCLAVAEASGWDSSVSAIQNACADADARQRILNGEGAR